MGAFPHIRYAAKSDVGRKRANNEDAFGAFPEAGIFCVADGMGGGDDGEVASAAVVSAVGRFTRECPLPDAYTYPVDGIVAGIRTAVNSASSWISARTQQKGLKGCGTTFVCLCLDAANPSAAVALHAGDSRLYRVRGRSIEQMTVDHSAAELIGAKDDEEVNPMFRGMILRAVGIQPSVELERTGIPLKVGDQILICSDGLSRMVDDKKILSVIRSGGDLETTVDALVSAANHAGGIDNITVVLISVGDFPEPLPTSPLAVENVDVEAVHENEESPLASTCAQSNGMEDSLFEAPTAEDLAPIAATTGDCFADVRGNAIEIPESDTEDELPCGAVQTAVAEVRPAVSVAPGIRTLVCRLLTNWIFLVAVSVSLLIAGLLVMSAHSRAKASAVKRKALETKIHRDEQKGSLQAVEEGRRNEREQKERDFEALKTRLEIQTPEKQRELDERARRAVERRMRDERAAKDKAEAEALRENEEKAREAARQRELREAEEQREARDREEARVKAAQAEVERAKAEQARREEAARIERLRREEDERRLKAEAEAKAKAAREEAEQREKERLAREEAVRLARIQKDAAEKAQREAAEKLASERKAQEIAAKQDLVVSTFSNVVHSGAATEFYAKVKQIVPESIPPRFSQRLSQSARGGATRAEKIAAIALVTENVQQIVRGLDEYSLWLKEDVKNDLANAVIHGATGDMVRFKKVSDGISAFEQGVGDFVAQESSDHEAQLKCASIIRLVPKWFSF